MEIKPARKIYALEAHITTVKYFSIEADSLRKQRRRPTKPDDLWARIGRASY